MGEHNYTGFRICDGELGCNGAGFKRFGAISDGGCSYVSCGRCGGTGQFYLEVKGNTAPVTPDTGPAPSLQAQRAANAPSIADVEACLDTKMAIHLQRLATHSN